MTVAVNDSLSGVVMATWSPERAASYVNESYRGAVAAYIETGRRLLEAKTHVVHGGWMDAVRLMEFSLTVAKQLMQIANNETMSNGRHDDSLPADYNTLAKLTQLTEPQLVEAIESGKVHPKMKRAEAAKLVEEIKNPPADLPSQAESPVNAVDDDGMELDAEKRKRISNRRHAELRRAFDALYSTKLSRDEKLELAQMFREFADKIERKR